MQFELSDEQSLIRTSARRFAEERLAPGATARDRAGRFPAELIEPLAQMGAMGMCTENEYGGAELDLLSSTLILEELARHDASVAFSVAAHNSLAIGHLRAVGTAEQKARWLPNLAAGRKLGAWALTEAGSGSDASAMRTTAKKTDAGYVLNGTKIFITHGTVGELCIVFAKTGRTISAFMVERDTPGFSQQVMHGKLGMRSSDTAELALVDVEVPADHLLGAIGRGLMGILGVLDRGRVGIGAIAVGIARACVEECRRYALDRQQFGRPIAEFQAIQFKLADMAMKTDAARLMVRRAALLTDQPRALSLASSQAKLFASEVAVSAALDAIQIHGGYGYTDEFPVERYLRDAKLLEIGEGTSELQRANIARHVMRR